MGAAKLPDWFIKGPYFANKQTLAFICHLPASGRKRSWHAKEPNDRSGRTKDAQTTQPVLPLLVDLRPLTSQAKQTSGQYPQGGQSWSE